VVAVLKSIWLVPRTRALNESLFGRRFWDMLKKEFRKRKEEKKKRRTWSHWDELVRWWLKLREMIQNLFWKAELEYQLVYDVVLGQLQVSAAEFFPRALRSLILAQKSTQ
jgi:hypothetical protein